MIQIRAIDRLAWRRCRWSGEVFSFYNFSLDCFVWICICVCNYIVVFVVFACIQGDEVFFIFQLCFEFSSIYFVFVFLFVLVLLNLLLEDVADEAARYFHFTTFTFEFSCTDIFVSDQISFSMFSLILIFLMTGRQALRKRIVLFRYFVQFLFNLEI